MQAMAPPVQNHSSSRSGSDREPDRVSQTHARTPPRGPVRSGSANAGFPRAGGKTLGVPAHLAQSKESFRQALDNPCQYFVGMI